MISQSLHPVRLLIAGCCVIAVSLASRAVGQQESADVASVVAARVIERDVETGHRAVGTVLPSRTSTVGSAVDGRVIELLVEAGNGVSAGDPIARLRTGTLEIERSIAMAELRVRQQELIKLQNGSRPEEQEAAHAKMLAAQATVTNALSRLKRLESLHAQGAANESDLDDARERADTAKQLWIAAKADDELLRNGPRAEDLAQAQARLELQQEQVRLIEDRIAKYTIYTPFDGFITAEYTQVGEWVSQGDPIAEVVALEKVDFQANVPAEHAVRLKRGRNVRVEFADLPGYEFSGQIAQIVPQGDMRTRSFPVTIRLLNEIEDGQPKLMAGMLGRAVLPTGTPKRLPLVPKDAVVLQGDGAGRFVFVVEAGSARGSHEEVRRVPVRLGVADGQWVQVDTAEATLQEGESVIVLGNERLKVNPQTNRAEVRIRRTLTPADFAAE